MLHSFNLILRLSKLGITSKTRFVQMKIVSTLLQSVKESLVK